MLPDQMRRVLVVTKYRYLGDTIVATPFFRRLREAAPQAEITLLSGPAMPVLLKGCPYLTSILPFDPKGPRRWSRNLQLIRDIRARNFDTAYLINRSLHTALIARFAGIQDRIGFDTEHRGPLLTRRVAYDWNKPDRECALDLLTASGIDAASTLPELWVDSEEREDASRLLQKAGWTPGQILIGMQPGAHDPEVREWGAAKFAAVADRLSAEYGASVVLLGSKEERAVSEEVASLAAVRPLVLTGETSLRQALAVISQCRLWVGNDGGLLHAAVALCPATVGIFGPTKAKRWGYETSNHRTVVKYSETGGTDSKVIRECLDAIMPEEVYSEALSAFSSANLDGERISP